jgi:hypothetical protein
MIRGTMHHRHDREAARGALLCGFVAASTGEQDEGASDRFVLAFAEPG